MSIAQSIFKYITIQHDKMIVCGGGHVSIPIIKIGKMLGFRVMVLEDRPLYANHAREAGANEVICEPFTTALKSIEGGKDAYFIVVTRGHRYDVECLRSILNKESAYVGMMGSKVRSGEVRKTLLEEGFSEESVARLHSPIGLPIGGETPEEIAVSVMAEIVQVRDQIRKQRKSDQLILANKMKEEKEESKWEEQRPEELQHIPGKYTQEVLQAILCEDKRKRCLATITMRKGSAPRSIGTKMVIFEDGICAGTIGGGCVEAEVVQEALHMLRQSEKECKTLHINMLPEQAEEEGMVCGGLVDITLELIDLDC